MPAAALAQAPAPVGSGPAAAFPTRRVVRAADDYPDPYEVKERGTPPLSEDEIDALLDDDEFPRAGDKLLGWPLWVQGVEYPECLECGARMELLFQLDPEDNLRYMFGDVGTGHITQCPRHRHRLAFGWACT